MARDWFRQMSQLMGKLGQLALKCCLHYIRNLQIPISMQKIAQSTFFPRNLIEETAKSFISTLLRLLLFGRLFFLDRLLGFTRRRCGSC